MSTSRSEVKFKGQISEAQWQLHLILEQIMTIVQGAKLQKVIGFCFGCLEIGKIKI